MEKITVIIPVYNVEKYLDRCIQSIVNQSYQNLEIILVDDGSKDTSGNICDKWVTIDSRINVIHKANAGLGEARNSGLEIATGEYISFVDSDDYLELNTYEVCMEKIVRKNADACYFNYRSVSNKKSVAVKNEMPEFFSELQIKQDLLPKSFGSYLDDKFYFQCSACMGLFSARLIRNNNIRFVSERNLISEDFVFTSDICLHAKRIVCTNEAFYNYWVNEESLTRSYKEDRINRILDFYENRVQVIESNQLSMDTLNRAVVRCWEMILACIKYEVKDERLTYERKMARINEVVKNDRVAKLYLPGAISHLNNKQQLVLRLLRGKHVKIVYLIFKLK